MVEITRVMVRNYKGEVNVVAFPKDVLCIEAKGGLRPTSSTQEFGQRLSQRGRGGETRQGGNLPQPGRTFGLAPSSSSDYYHQPSRVSFCIIDK